MSGALYSFEDVVLPHLDAAYNFARWILRNDAAAQDVVQESCMKALKGLHGYKGGNARAWLLTIVRNESYNWISKAKTLAAENLNDDASAEIAIAASHEETPEALLTKMQDGQALQTALEELPAQYRVALVLKELEEMSYKEIADVTGVPIGTVMSRLSRARALLKEKLLGKSHASKS